MPATKALPDTESSLERKAVCHAAAPAGALGAARRSPRGRSARRRYCYFLAASVLAELRRDRSAPDLDHRHHAGRDVLGAARSRARPPRSAAAAQRRLRPDRQQASVRSSSSDGQALAWIGVAGDRDRARACCSRRRAGRTASPPSSIRTSRGRPCAARRSAGSLGARSGSSSPSPGASRSSASAGSKSIGSSNARSRRLRARVCAASSCCCCISVLFSLFLLEPWGRIVAIPMLVSFPALCIAALLLPVSGVHRGSSRRKQPELARVDAALRAEAEANLKPGAAASAARSRPRRAAREPRRLPRPARRRGHLALRSRHLAALLRVRDARPRLLAGRRAGRAAGGQGAGLARVIEPPQRAHGVALRVARDELARLAAIAPPALRELPGDQAQRAVPLSFVGREDEVAARAPSADRRARRRSGTPRAPPAREDSARHRPRGAGLERAQQAIRERRAPAGGGVVKAASARAASSRARERVALHGDAGALARDVPVERPAAGERRRLASRTRARRHRIGGAERYRCRRSCRTRGWRSSRSRRAGSRRAASSATPRSRSAKLGIACAAIAPWPGATPAITTALAMHEAPAIPTSRVAGSTATMLQVARAAAGHSSTTLASHAARARAQG